MVLSAMYLTGHTYSKMVGRVKGLLTLSDVRKLRQYANHLHWVKANPTKVKALVTKWRQANQGKCRDAYRSWKQRNPGAQKQWRKSNPAKVRAAQKRAHALGKAECSNAYLASRLRNRIRLALKRHTKSASTMSLLGCTIDHLKLHLQSQFQPGMCWNNHGLWHIDHILPCARFDLSKPEQQRQCFHYTNLQPLWAMENISKGDKWQQVPDAEPSVSTIKIDKESF